MKTSQQVLEWKAETRQEDLLRVLEQRCHTPIPTDLAETISKLYDHNQLIQWLDAALTIDSFDAFRAAVNQPRPAQTNGST